MIGKRILVIEDEYLIALEMESELKKAGFTEVTCAATEKEALALIEEGTWDAAVADANLHGRKIDFVAAALNVRRIPYVVVTGYGRESLPSETAGAPLIAKPVQGRRLAQEITQLCVGKR